MRIQTLAALSSLAISVILGFGTSAVAQEYLTLSERNSGAQPAAVPQDVRVVSAPARQSAPEAVFRPVRPQFTSERHPGAHISCWYYGPDTPMLCTFTVQVRGQTATFNDETPRCFMPRGNVEVDLARCDSANPPVRMPAAASVAQPPRTSPQDQLAVASFNARPNTRTSTGLAVVYRETTEPTQGGGTQHTIERAQPIIRCVLLILCVEENADGTPYYDQGYRYGDSSGYYSPNYTYRNNYVRHGSYGGCGNPPGYTGPIRPAC